MSRAVWFVAGAGAGIYGMVRGRRAAEAFTAEGLQDRLGALFLGARLFRDEVAQGAADRETQLRERFELAPHGRHALTGPGVSTGSTSGGSGVSTGSTSRTSVDARQDERDSR